MRELVRGLGLCASVSHVLDAWFCVACSVIARLRGGAQLRAGGGCPIEKSV